MIIDGWVDWAERVDGPFNKQFPDKNRAQGIACHSVVGKLPGHAIPRRFFDANDAASVMFILYEDGHLIQMYPVTSSTWTSGSYEANIRFWAIEAEGGGAPDYGEKLTKAQEDTFIRLVTEWEAYTARKAEPGVSILQHKDLVRLYGGGQTACASDRYSNAWARVAAGERWDDMTPEEVQKLVDKRLDDTLGSTLLALLEQMVGIQPSTFSDNERVERILDELAGRGVLEHEHIVPAILDKTGGVFRG